MSTTCLHTISTQAVAEEYLEFQDIQAIQNVRRWTLTFIVSSTQPKSIRAQMAQRQALICRKITIANKLGTKWSRLLHQ